MNLYHYIFVYEHAAVNKTLRTLAEERLHGDEKLIIYFTWLNVKYVYFHLNKML